MRRILCLAAAAATACTAVHVKAAVPVKSLYALPACDDDPAATTRGIVNIILPKDFKGDKIKRAKTVNASKNTAPDRRSQKDGAENDADQNAPGADEPFDFYFGNSQLNDEAQGFILARVLITGGKFKFDRANAILWGLDADSAGKILCTSGPLVEDAVGGKVKDAAIFYIDIARLRTFLTNNAQGLDFNIKLHADDTSGAPLIIDPKIRNLSLLGGASPDD